MASYRLVTYQSEKGPRAGVAVDDKLFDAAALARKASYVTMLDILNDWKAAQGLLRKAAAGAGKSTLKSKPLARAKLLAPVLWPSAIYCAGANYTDHALEMAKAHNQPPPADPHDLGLKPWHFIKASRTVAADKTTIKLPAASNAIDWEAELGAVIGRTAKNVSLEKALDYVAGYTIANELSARDLGRRNQLPDSTPFKWDWVGQKCFDDACPLGPWIVPAQEIKDPQNLGIKLWVNDVIKQDSNTSKMIFTLAEQLAHLSSRITLHPGDIILTGTPSGVGAACKEFLKRGDVTKVWIEGIGTLTNKYA
ncbi:MAG TPA: fumarylacetoacetate hydrolase family protein [Xanthobacteraceae bacterium]|nr:fumarylacetoacetate hydrolase family protein [Xanthobacteraceae bacterium]